MAERSRYEDLELSTEQVMELAGPLATLVRTEGWAAYQELLKGRRIQYREILARGSKDQFDRIVGLVAGLEEAAELPETILRAANVVQQREDATAAKPQRRRSGSFDEPGPSFS
jgi:hypothetical protein